MNGDEDVEPQPELCDLCGTVVSDSSEWYALVPDSSAIHAVDAKFDGKRMVVGCTKERLAELVEQYKHRPFVDAELWAGQIARALQKYEGRISEEDLAEETGLTPDQIDPGVMWQNIEFLRWRQQFDHGDAGGPQERRSGGFRHHVTVGDVTAFGRTGLAAGEPSGHEHDGGLISDSLISGRRSWSRQ